MDRGWTLVACPRSGQSLGVESYGADSVDGHERMFTDPAIRQTMHRPSYNDLVDGLPLCGLTQANRSSHRENVEIGALHLSQPRLEAPQMSPILKVPVERL